MSLVLLKQFTLVAAVTIASHVSGLSVATSRSNDAVKENFFSISSGQIAPITSSVHTDTRTDKCKISIVSISGADEKTVDLMQ
jgi:hypothetical protein